MKTPAGNLQHCLPSSPARVSSTGRSIYCIGQASDGDAALLSGVIDYCRNDVVAGWIKVPAEGLLAIRVRIDDHEQMFPIENALDLPSSKVKYRITLVRSISARELAAGTVMLEALWNEDCVRLTLWTPIALAAQLEEAGDAILKLTIGFLQPQQRELLASLIDNHPTDRPHPSARSSAKPPQPRKLIVLVALQRSGTTAFCEALGRHDEVTSFGEVFHSARSRQDTPLYKNLRLVDGANFFDFREKLFSQFPMLSYPSPENVEAVLDAFLDHLSAMSKGWTLIDIKYNSWHHFETAWAMPARPPHMLKMLRARGAIFVHIKRRDLLARYASEMIANSRQLFHAEKDTELSPISIDLPPDRVSASIREARAMIQQFDAWLAPVEARLDINYEDLLVDNAVSHKVIEWLSSATGLNFDQTPWPVPLKKVVQSPSDLISNWAQLRKKFPPTPLAPESRLLDPDSQVAELLTLSRATLRETLVAGSDKQYSYGRKVDLDDHMQMLSREFTGASSLLLYHAVINFLIRRSVDLKANMARFLDLWKNDREFLLDHLDSRWLVSACDTIADHHPDSEQRALAAAGTLFTNTVRVYETERLLSGKGNAEAIDAANIPDLCNRVGFYDGLTAFAIGQGDAIQNLFRRIEQLGVGDTPAGAILFELIARANANDTVFGRFRTVHRNPATMW